MAEITVKAAGQAPAQPAYVSMEEFERLLGASEARLEWSQGRVIEMPDQTDVHNALIKYFAYLLDAYFEQRPLGRTYFEFRQSMKEAQSQRFPDVMIVLNDNPIQVPHLGTRLAGPADICIEVVSQGSIAEDYGHKFEEYQQGGVKEYWLFNPINAEHRIYRLDEAGIYRPQQLDAAELYHTPLLPGFALHVPTLWAEALPKPSQIVNAVQAMLEGQP